jgi:hypothetical protein
MPWIWGIGGRHESAVFPASSLKQSTGSPRSPAELFIGSYTRMPSEPQSDVPPTEEGQVTAESSEDSELPVDLSEFTQRLASFGLGETPDPLLTEARPPAKRRTQI